MVVLEMRIIDVFMDVADLGAFALRNGLYLSVAVQGLMLLSPIPNNNVPIKNPLRIATEWGNGSLARFILPCRDWFSRHISESVGVGDVVDVTKNVRRHIVQWQNAALSNRNKVDATIGIAARVLLAHTIRAIPHVRLHVPDRQNAAPKIFFGALLGRNCARRIPRNPIAAEHTSPLASLRSTVRAIRPPLKLDREKRRRIRQNRVQLVNSDSIVIAVCHAYCAAVFSSETIRRFKPHDSSIGSNLTSTSLLITFILASKSIAQRKKMSKGLRFRRFASKLSQR